MLKNLYLIFREGSNKTTFKLLKESAEKRGIKINVFFSDKFDFSAKFNLTEEDGLYRIGSDKKSSLVEKYLINSNVTSLYSNYLFCVGKLNRNTGSSLIHQKYGLPIIKTILSITNDRELLKRYSEYLDGFPLIIKFMGGSHGVGIIKIDSFDSLVSIADFLYKNEGNFIMRSFIKHKEQARIIVLKEKVIASHTNIVTTDFRTNVGDIDLIERRFNNYDENIRKIAVKAVNSLGYEFGGVDILFDENTNEPFIAEVNFPCFFATTQKFSGVDISGAIVDYLIEKSNRVLTTD